MARCRGIKPGFMTNEVLPELGAHAHLLFACLWLIADKDGRLEDRPKRIKLECMPAYDVDVDELLSKLAQLNDPFIIRYEVDGRRYIQICNWRKHQTPHHTEKDSEIPAPPLTHRYTTVNSPLDNGQGASCTLTVNSKQLTEEKGCGEKPKPSGKHFAKPTLDEVAAYCRERGKGVNPEVWYDHYESNGWKVGKNAMKDWRAAVRKWEHSEYGSKANPPPTGKQFLEVTPEEFKRLRDLDSFKIRPYREKLPDGRVHYTGQKRDGTRVECFIEGATT